ncbi:hypothetical protein [Mesorhizobium sp. INR15]|uniref:hypothetical protein n=1 Tax=Mesorhizobium sp. INR15 TaxID=2654248 RepID=UPI0018969FAE|nr:hypothetical protein [Mesorhizobium sp. INR15]QPC89174.1 hypothetical protein GA829_00405 [Mesorhizobium sp. INR15]
MRWNMVVLTSCLAVSGCVGNSMSERQDEKAVSSLQFDAVPCDQLLVLRNDLAQRYNLAQDVKPTFSNPAMGFGPFTPDMRSKSQREVDDATGQIDAMNRSIGRRQCGQPDQPKKFTLPG